MFDPAPWLRNALARRVVTASLAACAAVFCVAAAAGVVRLLPWWLSPEIPGLVSWEFAKALLASAADVALVMGVPLGVALGAAIFVDAGEARALFALGLSPARLIASCVPAMVALCAALTFLNVSWAARSDVSERVAERLIASGRAACAGEPAARSVTVPLVNVTWLCVPGAAPRVVSEVPGLAGQGWLSAGEVVVEHDALVLRDARFALRPSRAKTPSVGVHVREARVSGLPWQRSVNDRPALVARWLVALCALALSVSTGLCILHLALASRLSSLAIAGVAGACLFSTLHALERGRAGVLGYVMSGFAVSSPGLFAVAARWFRRLFAGLG